ncbi:MAG TPA: radical SAM protein [Planctomycetota bacterium]|nr:radical SAM protein [Planctomycetota bacterium]
MADPKHIERVLKNPLTRALLVCLTSKRRGRSCLLERIFAAYDRDDLPLVTRLVYAVPFALADLIRTKAGASVEQVRDGLFRHPSRSRALVNTARGVAQYGLVKPQVFSAPLMVVWNFTQACNLKFIHCYQDAHKRLPDELNEPEQVRIVDELADNDVSLLAFSGGEPMMSPSFWPVLTHAGKKGFHISVATNGTLLDETSARRLGDCGVNFIEISLDSVSAEKHDRFRGGKGYWQKAVDGIKACVAAREKHGHRFGVSLASTITQMNFDEMEDLISFAKELGCTSFYAFNFIPTGRAKSVVDMDLTPDQREEMLRILYDHMCSRDVGIITSAAQMSRKCVETSKLDGVFGTGHYGYGPGLNAMILSQYIGGCGAGRCYCAVQPDGRVTPCVFMQLVVGDLRRQTLRHIWHRSNELKVLRDREDRTGGCKSCDYKIYCGGCRARAFGYYGDITRSDPGCRFNLEQWNELRASVASTRTAADAAG